MVAPYKNYVTECMWCVYVAKNYISSLLAKWQPAKMIIIESCHHHHMIHLEDRDLYILRHIFVTNWNSIILFIPISYRLVREIYIENVQNGFCYFHILIFKCLTTLVLTLKYLTWFTHIHTFTWSTRVIVFILSPSLP